MVAVEPLSELLDLRQTGDDTFEGPTHGPDAGVQRIFGGHVASQALLAATWTVADDRILHATHCTFIRSGRPGIPVQATVRRDRDGRAFSTRQVTVRQGPNVIFEMTASFHTPEDSGDWTATPMPDRPGPDGFTPHPTFINDLPTLDVFEWRALGEGPHPAWARTVEALPDDPRVHLAVLGGLTDAGSVRTTMAPGFERLPGMTAASLNHSVWFHRPARIDGWLLFEMEPLSNHAGRGFGLGRVWARDGTHVLTWVQESLLRAP